MTHLFHFDYYELPAPVDAVCPPPRADRFRSPVVRRRHFRWSGRGGAKLTHRPLTLSADVPTKTHSPRGASSAVSSKAKILARSHASAGASSIGGCQGAGAVISMSSRRSQDQKTRCGCSGAAWLHAVNGLGSWRQTIRLQLSKSLLFEWF